MSGSRAHPLEGICEVDGILIGGKQEGKRGRGAEGKKKAFILIEKGNKGGTERAYGVKAKDFSTKGLRKIFDSIASAGSKGQTL